jgi:hypothetical protein
VNAGNNTSRDLALCHLVEWKDVHIKIHTFINREVKEHGRGTGINKERRNRISETRHQK